MRHSPARAVPERRLAAAGVVAALLVAAAPPATAQEPFRNVLPGGQGETVNATEFGAFQAGGERPETFVDQLPLYSDLVQAAPGLTSRDLDKYFKPRAFGTDGSHASSRPRGPGSRSIATPTGSEGVRRDARPTRCSAPATRRRRTGCS